MSLSCQLPLAPLDRKNHSHLIPIPSYSIENHPVDSALAHKLLFVRHKNLMAEIPLKLRLLSYLRISCLVMQRLKFENFGLEFLESSKSHCQYATLHQQLLNLNSHWWETCQVLADGSVVSDDDPINNLLQPLYQLHWIFMKNSF